MFELLSLPFFFVNREGENIMEANYDLDPTKPIATFYVAWNGEGAGSFFDIFATRREAERMTWVDTMWRNPRTRKPRVTEWKVGITKAGDPIIIAPQYDPSHPEFERVGEKVAIVPFRSRGCRNDDRMVAAGVPFVSRWEPRDRAVREALLGYHEKYSSSSNIS
ncbi:MAG: hypothetical protein A3J54_02130 [Candidatus Ryanbacteria bacterium RIFCSPHIGHO2_02_FULL_45_13b]|uniref:Uncharacterized protein n=1 Tax=Candidatus Ryanbacteria bacterium RIFCSPHIGHO2_02_FULL_45_13b TaxID=1802117 RepID=A0A1G2G6X6_9BACT|nr:MAG: hypothetical protein A3J54_02130 [Candidatus Ryanbacteria bacterium RIFCSPHIGHO2_02_FULL_45_13b]